MTTDNEIKKALECCATSGDFTKSQIEICSPCPYDTYGDCTGLLKANALDLINRLQTKNSNLTSDLTSLQNDLTSLKAENEALINGQETLQKYLAKKDKEIERLKDETAEMLSTLDYRAKKILESVDKLEIAQAENERLTHITRNLVGEIKAEAITDFVFRLEDELGEYYLAKRLYVGECIDKVKKEMVGDSND